MDVKPLGAPGTDVSACKTDSERLLAVATIGMAGKHAPGRVLLYTVGSDGKLTFKREFDTKGSLPDQITFTKDCRSIIAAIEGEAVPVGTGLGKPHLPMSSFCHRGASHVAASEWWRDSNTVPAGSAASAFVRRGCGSESAGKRLGAAELTSLEWHRKSRGRHCCA